MTQSENKIDVNELQEALIDRPDFLKDISKKSPTKNIGNTI